MMDARVDGIVDFSGVEVVFCADNKIRLDHFSANDWVEEATFCVPEDIFSQLENVDSMIDDEDSYLSEINKMVGRVKDKENDVFLYHFNDNQQMWEVKAVSHKITKHGQFWLVFWIDRFGNICYATIASVIRNGVAPW
jgi:hypothetical protein